MDSGLTEDDKRRIDAFCDTPPTNRSPELLTPGDDEADDAEDDRSRLRALLQRLGR